MMTIFLSESMCKKLCVNVVFVSYDFPKKKIGKKRSEKRMRSAVGDRALVGLLSRARNRGALRTRAHVRRRKKRASIDLAELLHLRASIMGHEKPVKTNAKKREDSRCFARRRRKQADACGEASYSMRSCDAHCPFVTGSRQLQQQH